MDDFDFKKEKYIEERKNFKSTVEVWNNRQMEHSKNLKERWRELKTKLNNKIKSSSELSNNSQSSIADLKKINEIRLDIDKMKYIYESKLQQLKVLKSNLAKEKLNFEQKINDIRSKIKKERNDIDTIRIEQDRKNDDIQKKNFELNKKEKILKEQNDEYANLQNLIKEKHNKNLKDEKDLEKAEYKANIFQNEIFDKNSDFENQKNFLKQEIKNLEDSKLELFNNKNDIEQIKKEINLRMRCINDLNENNIINEFNYITNNIIMKEKKEEIDSDFLNNINNKDIIYNRKDKYNKFNKFTTNSFNSELYLLKLKNRIDINKIKLNNKYDPSKIKFNHEKEQEYLLKSYESLNKIKK